MKKYATSLSSWGNIQPFQIHLRIICLQCYNLDYNLFLFSDLCYHFLYYICSSAKNKACIYLTICIFNKVMEELSALKHIGFDKGLPVLF